MAGSQGRYGNVGSDDMIRLVSPEPEPRGGWMMKMLLIGAALVMSVFPQAVSAGTETEEEKAAKLQQATIVGAEISAFANQLGLRPETAIDKSKISGQYCFYSGADKISGWDKHHTHYAIDPTKTQEDVIDYVDARPLLEAGVNVEDLPRLPVTCSPESGS